MSTVYSTDLTAQQQRSNLPTNKRHHGTTAGLLLWWRQTKGAKLWTWLQWSFDKGLEALLLLFWPHRLLVAGLPTNGFFLWKDSYGFLRSLCGISGFSRVCKMRTTSKSWGVFLFEKLLLEREIPKDDGARLFFGGFQRSGFQHDLFFDLWGYWWSCMARLSEEGQFFSLWWWEISTFSSMFRVDVAGTCS